MKSLFFDNRLLLFGYNLILRTYTQIELDGA